MKLTGELKNQVENAESREAAREAIANAGMLLNDNELDQVAGGWAGKTTDSIFNQSSDHLCDNCGGSKIYKSGRGWYCKNCEGDL